MANYDAELGGIQTPRVSHLQMERKKQNFVRSLFMAQPLPAWNEKSPPGGKVCRGNEDRLAIRLCEGEMAPLICVCDEMGLAGRVSAYNSAIPLLKKLEQGRGQSGRQRGVREKMHKQLGINRKAREACLENPHFPLKDPTLTVCVSSALLSVCVCVCVSLRWIWD